jgi:hypothetical protein
MRKGKVGKERLFQQVFATISGAMAWLLAFLLAIALSLLLSVSGAVAALGFPPLSGIIFASSSIVAQHPAKFASLLSLLTFMIISRQSCRWRRRRPPAGQTRKKIGKPSQHVVLRILSALFRAWIALLCLAHFTRASHDLLFGASEAPRASQFLVHRNELAMPDTHEHHSRTLLDFSAESRLSRTYVCLLSLEFWSLNQGDHSGRTVTNHPVTTTKSAFTHRLFADQLHAESAPTSLSVHHFARCSSHSPAHACHKAQLYVNNFFLSSRNASHQTVATLRSLPAHTHSPVRWAHNPFTDCTSLPTLNTSGIVHFNPVAASLRLPTAVHRFMGIVPALFTTARELQHYLRTAKAGWATPAAASARWAWAAAWDYSVQLGRVHAEAAFGQVCDPAPVSGTMYAHLSGESAVLFHVVYDLCSVVATWLYLFVQFLVTVCCEYPVIVICFVLSLLSAELTYRLLRLATGHGRAIADALAEIEAAPETHCMALRLQLYRHSSGRQHRRSRTVSSPGRPLQLRREFTDFAVWQLRALAILLVTLIVGYAYLAVTIPAKIHTYMEQSRPAVEPVQSCWYNPDTWLETGVVVCGFPTTDTDCDVFPTSEQGGAFAVSNAFPLLVELQSLWKPIFELLLTLSPAFGHPSWCIPEAWDLPGSLFPMIIPPTFNVPQIVPPYQTSYQTLTERNFHTAQILASVSNLATTTLQVSLTSRILTLIRPPTALVVASGLSHVPSVLVNACLVTWLGLLVTTLSQLCRCKKTANSCGTAENASAHEDPDNTTHRSVRKGAARAKRCIDYPCREENSVRAQTLNAETQTTVVTEGIKRDGSPVPKNMCTDEPPPAPANNNSGSETTRAAVSLECKHIPVEEGNTGVMTQYLFRHVDRVTRSFCMLMSSTTHSLFGYSLLNLCLHHRLCGAENPVFPKAEEDSASNCAYNRGSDNKYGPPRVDSWFTAGPAWVTNVLPGLAQGTTSHPHGAATDVGACGGTSVNNLRMSVCQGVVKDQIDCVSRPCHDEKTCQRDSTFPAEEPPTVAKEGEKKKISRVHLKTAPTNPFWLRCTPLVQTPRRAPPNVEAPIFQLKRSQLVSRPSTTLDTLPTSPGSDRPS